MKKFISIILVLIYFSLSTGAIVTLHYCGGRLESITLNSEAQACCCAISGMTIDCCENEEFRLDIDIDENVAFSSDIAFKNFSQLVYSSLTSVILNEVEIEDEQLATYNLPPPKPESIWLMNCTFIFYG